MKLTEDERRKIYGSRVNGAAKPVIVHDDSKPPCEMVFPHALPAAASDELWHLVQPKAVIDVVIADCKRALLAIKRGIPYLGFALTDEHKKWAEEITVALILREFNDLSSQLYRKAFEDDFKPLYDHDSVLPELEAQISEKLI